MLLIASAAHAFCGYYAGDDGQAITNASSIVVLAQDDDQVHLTVANDFEGDTADFALLIPVPALLSQDDVREVDPAWLDRLDGYSAPRRVNYPCYDEGGDGMYYDGESGGGGLCGCGGGADSGGYVVYEYGMGVEEESVDTTVTVEAEFATSTYTFQLLSAEESNGLLVWLADNGYVLPQEASDMLQEYIDAGTYFLVAKVKLDGALSDPAWLPPIQVDYTATQLGLPIRLGTLSSSGQQDLLLYTLTSVTAGATAVANYEEATVETECVVAHDDDFTAFYEDQFATAVEEIAGAAWVREYAWRSEQCDPCTSEPLDDTTVQAFGRSSAADTVLTRIHMRYQPGDIDEDLVLYTSGIEENIQMRYIEDTGCPDGYPECDGVAAAGPPAPSPWRSLRGPGAALAGLAFGVGRRRRR